MAVTSTDPPTEEKQALRIREAGLLYKSGQTSPFAIPGTSIKARCDELGQVTKARYDTLNFLEKFNSER